MKIAYFDCAVSYKHKEAESVIKTTFRNFFSFFDQNFLKWPKIFGLER